MQRYFEKNPDALRHEVAIDFPTALSMYNLGIKDRRIQSSTLQSVKFLDSMRAELGRLMVSDSKIDKQKRKELEEPTTTFFLHKNYVNMRALYGPNDGQRKLPQVLNSPEMEMVQGKSPVNKTNFTQNYIKL